jgi:signal peptidase I
VNDLAPIFARVAAINPIPDETDLPADAKAMTALLVAIDERTRTLQTNQTNQTNRVETSRHDVPKRGRTGAWLAVATFAAIVVIGGVVAFIGEESDNSPSAVAAQPEDPSRETVLASDATTRLLPRSMENAIGVDALLTVDRTAYDTSGPERLDIVLYADARVSDVDQPQDLVSRVIGLPGETIESRDGRVYINGSVLDEPYIKSPELWMPRFEPVTLGADELWLMGDNRQTGADSLFRGPIEVSLLRAKIIEISNP